MLSEQVKVHLELGEVLLEQVRIFNAASSFNQFWKYYQNRPKFNGVYLRNNFPKIEDGAYVINLGEYK